MGRAVESRARDVGPWKIDDGAVTMDGELTRRSGELVIGVKVLKFNFLRSEECS